MPTEYIHQDFKHASVDTVARVLKKYLRNFEVHGRYVGDYHKAYLKEENDITKIKLASWTDWFSKRFPKSFHDEINKSRNYSWAVNKLISRADDADIFGKYLVYQLNGLAGDARIAIYDTESLDILLGRITPDRKTEVVVEIESKSLGEYIPSILERIASRERLIMPIDPFHDI